MLRACSDADAESLNRPPVLIRLLFRPCLALFLIALALSPALGAEKAKKRRPLLLAQRIDSILREKDARRGFWGIDVVRLPDGKVLYARDADHLFLPASNQKLFTTAAAIEKLGPDYVFRTTVESEAPPDAAGKVGDLILVGRGDPNIGSRVLPYRQKTQWQDPADAVLQELADQVVAKGVREVQGNLVADDTYFVFDPFPGNWTTEDLQWGYGAPVTALAFNDNQLSFHVYPGAQLGEPAVVLLAPISDYYKVTGHLETTAKDTRKHIQLERLPGSLELSVWGQVPLGEIDEEEPVAIDSPPQLVGTLFRRALEARGVLVRGELEVRELTRLVAAKMADPPEARPARTVLAEHRSLSLREDVVVVNKVSQNLRAEMLLRTLGKEVKNAGTLEAGLAVLEEFAAEAGLVAGESHFADGSGLSRGNLIAPHAIVKLLTYMARSPRFDAFLASLPVAGRDGTLESRFEGTRAEGRIRAKTGSIEHTNALSGFMDLPSGKRLAFSIIGNSHTLNSSDGAGTIDRLALSIFERFRARR